MSGPSIQVLIERWQNVERVLTNMPQHEREKHWRMVTWGHLTDCGTVACAAGHCGLDPWFQSQGLTLQPASQHSDETATFSGREPEDILPEFFGSDGFHWIFTNGMRRSVDAVIDEVREHIQWLQKRQSQQQADSR